MTDINRLFTVKSDGSIELLSQNIQANQTSRYNSGIVIPKSTSDSFNALLKMKPVFSQNNKADTININDYTEAKMFAEFHKARPRASESDRNLDIRSWK